MNDKTTTPPATPDPAPAPASVSTEKLRNIVRTAGYALESGLVSTVLNVLGIVPGAGLVALALKEGLPMIGQALVNITAPTTTLEEVAEAVGKMRRVAKFDVTKEL